MTSDRTKHCKKMRNIFGIISYCIWLGTIAAIMIMCFSKVENAVDKETMQILSNELKEKIYAFAITAAVGIIATIFIKEKARTFMYMLSIILSVILKGEVGMYIVLSIYAVDEFVIRVLYKYYANKVSINKEIDLRE